MRYEYDFAKDSYADLLKMSVETVMPVRRRYEIMYRVLVSALNNRTKDVRISFAGTFARLDYLCRETGYRERNPKGYRRICTFRGRSTHLRQYTDEQLQLALAEDLRALCQLLEVLFGSPIPDGLRKAMAHDYSSQHTHELIADCLRVCVRATDEDWLYLNGPQGEDLLMPWISVSKVGQVSADMEHLRRIVVSGTQLNLVHPWEEDGSLRAQYIIYEPDILIDISSVAHGFCQTGPSAYLYLLDRLDDTTTSGAMLLGNFAGQMLDEEVHGAGKEPVSYQQSVERFFRDNALGVVSCSDLQLQQNLRDFHNAARQQQFNLRHIVNNVFVQDHTIDITQVVLEPSFYCEMLGLQGRMDLLQADKHVLMEQKSGKMDEFRHSHQQQHFIQVLLYQAMLHFAYHDKDGRALRNDDIASYLLYSKYPDGLMKEAPAPVLLSEALKLRNQMAHLELILSSGEARNIFMHLTPEKLNVSRLTGKLWDMYIRPRLAELLGTIQKAPSVEQDYFFRMLTFVAKEHLLSKVGTSEREASGFAALWNSTPAEKREAGNLMDGLRITSIGDDLEMITLFASETDEMILPNFRIGDIVIMYAYNTDQEPDARRDMVFRASIVEMSSDSIVLRLRSPQKNRSLFRMDDDVMWAIEHDFMESSYSGLYRGLFMMLKATPDRRQLLMTQREARTDRTLTLNGEYGKFNDLVLKAKQARDYFLLIGPPGTGKTSCGLVNILNEELSCGSDVLMVSYTNRAVDEICSKLEKIRVQYVRIGSDISCPEEYRSHLLSECTKECRSAQEIRNMIQSTHVVVGTTMSVSSQRALFRLKAFDLCIIDEASQILEPHLLTLLSARHGEDNAISRFVLIGDHKQLPAVVQQNEKESVVTEQSLNAIGLLDCRQSLFERLLRTAPDDVVYRLSAQGRMHHKIADFPNRAFYENLLVEVPLEHQQRDIPFSTGSNDSFARLLTERRVAFLPVYKKMKDTDLMTSDKVNPEEAMLIARLVQAVRDLYQENGLVFNPMESVGIIVPYRHQISTIRKELERISRAEGNDGNIFADVTIDTVERYQGSQRDVIIYGFTISKEYQLTFLTNNRFEENGFVIDRKLNVAMTRARETMLMVGDPNLLKKDRLFARLIEETLY